MRTIHPTLLLLFALLLGPFSEVKAQAADSTTVRYAVNYLREHKLMQRGAETNVVDLDLEWPLAVDGQKAEALQSFLAKQLFHLDARSLQEALPKFYTEYGTEVKSQFQEIPDDRKFCYIDLKLRILGHETGSYISFQLNRTVSPQSLSTIKGDTTEILFTYDLQRGEVLLQNDILRSSRIGGYGGYSFLQQLVLAFPDGVPDNIEGMSLHQACLTDEGLLCYVTFQNNEGSFFQPALLNPESVSSFLTKNARRLLNPKGTVIGTTNIALRNEISGTSIYKEVDQQPEYPGGTQAMQTFIGSHLDFKSMNAQAKGTARVAVSLVLDAEGHPCDFTVLEPSSPTVDRAVVAMLRMMPTWKPAMKGSKAVASRITQPVVIAFR